MRLVSLLLEDLNPLSLKLEDMVLYVVFEMGGTIMDGGFRPGNDVVWLLVKARELFGGVVVCVIR